MAWAERARARLEGLEHGAVLGGDEISYTQWILCGFAIMSFNVLGTFLPALPGGCRHAHPQIKTPPGEPGLFRSF